MVVNLVKVRLNCPDHTRNMYSYDRLNLNGTVIGAHSYEKGEKMTSDVVFVVFTIIIVDNLFFFFILIDIVT